MAEEIAGLYVSIGADMSGLQTALEATRLSIAELQGENGLLGGLALQVQTDAQNIVAGIQAGLAPLPDVLQKGLQEPVIKVLSALSAQIQAQMQAMIQQLHALARQVHNEALALGIKSPVNIAHLEGRAEGGPVTSGRPYLVGEAGPEIFIPGVSGQIIPNQVGMSIRGGTFHFHGVQDVEGFWDALQRVSRQRGA